MIRHPLGSSLFLLLFGNVLFLIPHPSIAQPIEEPGSVQDPVRQDSIVADGATEAGFASSEKRDLTATGRWRALQSEVTNTTFLFASVGPATGDHLSDDPASWRSDVVGFGLRVGSNAGRQLIESGTTHGLAATARLDLRFRPCGHGGIGSRIRCGTLEALTARTPGGKRVPNVPRVVGTYGAALAQQRWQSGEVRPGDAALTTALGLGIDVVVSVITEFAGGS